MTRKQNLLIVPVLALFLAGVATISSGQDKKKSWKKSVVGTYKGTVNSGGEPYPIVTTFEINKKGELVGKYEVEDSGEKYPGKLTGFETKGERTGVFTWEDQKGTGSFVIIFYPISKGFKGYWSEEDPVIATENNSWAGKR